MKNRKHEGLEVETCLEFQTNLRESGFNTLGNGKEDIGKGEDDVGLLT